MSDYMKKRLEQKMFGKPVEPKPVYRIPKKSNKKIEQEAKEREERSADDTELVKWFKARIKVMGDTCNWCGCKIENKIYQYAIYSICHILDKREKKCPSVKYHPLNYIALCPNHHTMFDTLNWTEREKLKFWETIRNRLILIYPDLDPSERRHFPESVLEYMKKNDAFERVSTPPRA